MLIRPIPIARKVREFLISKPPLSIVKLDDLYRSVAINERERHAARAALYHQAAGTSVSERNKPAKYYAVRLPIKYSDNDVEDVFLSLPGIPRDRILHDVSSTKTISQIIAQLKAKYGGTTVEYWCKAAQYRTVDFARPGMKKAVERDQRTCHLCKVTNAFRQRAGFASKKPKPVRACHIISRKAIFWTILEEIDKAGYSIFSNSGVTLIQQKLKDEPLHSDEQFIIALCSEHDSILLDALRTSSMAQWKLK